MAVRTRRSRSEAAWSVFDLRPVLWAVLLGAIAGCGQNGAPAAIILATSEQESLSHYARIADHLPGWRVLSLDLPAHGADQRPGEGRPLDAWRARLDAGENLVRDFTVRLSRLIDTLPSDRIALVGTSRGGFMALHGMAADPRVDAVVAFMPVTQLRTLREFARSSPRYDDLDVVRLPLRGRHIWIRVGRDDHRVSTAAAAHAADALGATFQITPAAGHTIAADDTRAAAAWLLGRM